VSVLVAGGPASLAPMAARDGRHRVRGHRGLASLNASNSYFDRRAWSRWVGMLSAVADGLLLDCPEAIGCREGIIT
jgi:hypothetical protein